MNLIPPSHDSADPTEMRCADPRLVVRRAAEVGIEHQMLRPGPHALALWSCPAVGSRTAAPVLLLHGVTYSSMSVFDLAVPGHPRRDYSLIAQMAEAGIDTFALDFAGYGLSASDPEVRQTGDHVDQVRVAIAEIRARTGCRPVVVGWSWSGHVVGSLGATVSKDEVAGIVIWGAQWGGGPAGRPGFILSMSPPASPRRVNSAAHAGADFRNPGHYDPAVRDAFVDWARFLDPTSPTLGLAELVAAMPLFNPARFSMPVLVLHGSHDPVVVEEDVVAMLDAITVPDTSRIIVPGGDHNAQYNYCRQAVVAHIAAFAGKFAGGR